MSHCGDGGRDGGGSASVFKVRGKPFWCQLHFFLAVPTFLAAGRRTGGEWVRARSDPIRSCFSRLAGGLRCVRGGLLCDLRCGHAAIEYDAGRCSAGIGKDQDNSASGGACRHQPRQRRGTRQSPWLDAELGGADRALSPLQKQAGPGGSWRAAKRCLRPHQGLCDRASRRTIIGAAGANRGSRARISGCELDCGKILIRRTSWPLHC
jgi:hypothetical protein